MSLIEHETEFRLIFFLGVLASMMVAEQVFALKTHKAFYLSSWTRLTGNFGLLMLSALLLKLLPFASAILAGSFAETNHFGLLNQLSQPLWITYLLAFLALDLAIYWQHRISHRWQWLWRLHRVHHADPVLDSSSALRFHPIEIVLSMLFKMLIVLCLGAPVEIIIIFEIILNAGALFNHSRIKLPPTIERTLRYVIVTPEMHIIHHSPVRAETDSNYGFFLSIWDRIFNTYLAISEQQKVGLNTISGKQATRLDHLLIEPFK